MRINPVLIHMQQQARKPPQLLYVQAHAAKLDAKINLMKGQANKDQNAYINYALEISAAKAESAKQFLEAGESYYPWHPDAVAELGTILIGNMLDRYV